MIEYQILIAIAISFFVTGGLARASGRRWAPWVAISLLITPLLAVPLLLGSIIVYGKLHQNDVVGA